jgi:ABC-type transport system involved in Fe-S cluster assembly fused permease/ATPase subunit
MPSRETGGAGRIEVSGLEFRYNEQLPYLYRDLDFTLELGEMVVVIGSSGSGKSTLVKLLLGFYQPSDGSIQIDKRDIRHLSANELRQYFGVVPQETTLFSGSIYDNLQAGNPAARFGNKGSVPFLRKGTDPFFVLCITHQIPKGLKPDRVVVLGGSALQENSYADKRNGL